MPSPFQQHLDNERAIRDNGPALDTTKSSGYTGRWVNASERLPDLGTLVYTKSPDGLLGAYTLYEHGWSSYISTDNEPIAEWYENFALDNGLGTHGKFARLELTMLPDDSEIKPLAAEIIALVNKAVQGHSGGSYSVVGPAIAETVRRLLFMEALGPISGNDEEWVRIHEDQQTNEIVYQNARCGQLFKDANGRAWFLDAIIWRTKAYQDNPASTYSGTAQLIDGDDIVKVYSRQFVKSFPFEPKTFYVDAVEIYHGPSTGEIWLEDDSQLKEVFDYYDRYEPAS